MLELLQLKQKIETQKYTGANSLFELRIHIMDTATFLAKKHITNFRLKEHKLMASTLVNAFSNIKQCYEMVGANSDENCFLTAKELVLADISNVLSYHTQNTSGYRIIPLQNTSSASFGLAK